MDALSGDAAAEVLEEYAGSLRGAASMKWTGEFGPAALVEARLLMIAVTLRGGVTATVAPPPEEDALFLRAQAESLRSPNKLLLDDPLMTAEWQMAAEHSFRVAEQLEAVADLLERKQR